MSARGMRLIISEIKNRFSKRSVRRVRFCFGNLQDTMKLGLKVEVAGVLVSELGSTKRNKGMINFTKCCHALTDSCFTMTSALSMRTVALLVTLCCNLLVGCVGSHATKEISEPSSVVIDLQSGFDRSPVNLKVNGATLLEQSISSDPVLGFATAVQTSPGTSFDLEITLSNLKQSARCIVNPSKGRFIGVRLDYGERIKIVQQAKPFCYD